MIYACVPCDRYFGSNQSLQQHLDSPVHDFHCDECDRPFRSQHALQQHLDSPAHDFDCDECGRTFTNQHALQQHLESPAHTFDCEECDRIFKSQEALQQHQDSPAHVFGCNECDRSFKNQHALQQHLDSSSHIPKALNSYSGIPRAEVAPVFATACRLRFTQPTATSLSKQVKTNLEEAVLSAIIAAALRLLPTVDTPEGIALRKEQIRVRAAKAKFAEDSFCAELTRLGYKFRRESQQEGEAVTPDIRFDEPISVFGQLCWWLEFKNYFGFRKNPFVAAKDKRQFLRYATQIGPGAVVYKLGFETSHVNIEGVVTFREKEVLQGLRLQIL
ncbi:hypothetical protein ACEPPN_006538 [Leptodophora sp. 'Broadleaf-Isolate-01']